jgi:hypothetical protein
MILQDVQQFGLQERMHLADFVEEQRPLVRQFEFAGFRAGRSGKGALLVAEQLAFQQLERQSGTVDLHKLLRGAFGTSMEMACDHFLSHSAFAQDQNRNVAGGDPLDFVANLLHLR